MREASEILGKNPRYFITLKQREPEYFEEVTFRPVGTALVLTGKDIKKVISKVKKEGDPLRTVILKAVYKVKKNKVFAFTLKLLLYLKKVVKR